MFVVGDCLRWEKLQFLKTDAKALYIDKNVDDTDHNNDNSVVEPIRRYENICLCVSIG